MNILLVDDEPRVLSGLERVLATEAPAEWQVFTATSGPGALEILAHGGIDVVVSDMRMPGMTGADLLNIVHERWPGAARMILSGQTDHRASLRVASVAHQFFDKPCDSRRLLTTLTRIATARDLFGADILPMLGRIGGLPAAPKIYWELCRLLEDDNAGADRIVAVVRRDPALVASVLKVVNSSFFGRGAVTTDLGSAVRRLGMELVRAIALDCASQPGGDSLEGSRLHGLRVAGLAEAVAPDSSREDVFVAGILHDLGERVLVPTAGDAAAQLRDRIAHGEPRHLAERAVLGVTHAEMGGYLLTLWGFSTTVARAVAHHHGVPSEHGAPDATTAAVHVAEALWEGREPDPACVRALGHDHPPAAWAEHRAALESL